MTLIEYLKTDEQSGIPIPIIFYIPNCDVDNYVSIGNNPLHGLDRFFVNSCIDIFSINNVRIASITDR